MLAIYRRHSPRCDQNSRRYRRCNCPVWCEGTLEGKYLRRALKVRSWERAEKLVREMQDSGNGKISGRTTVEQACDAFIRDAESRQLKHETVNKFRLLFRRLKEFSAVEGIQFLASRIRFGDAEEVSFYVAREELRSPQSNRTAAASVPLCP